MYTNSGIYQIRNIINNKIYIGSSANIKKRWSEHKRDLKNNKHDNGHLQGAYNKYGVSVFEYTSIKACPPIKDILLFHEQLYLDYYWDGGKTCYNIYRLANSPLGYKWTEEQKTARSERMSGELNPFFNKKHTDETKRVMSENHVDYSGKNHPGYGKIGKLSPIFNIPKSEEHRERIGKAQTGEKNHSAKLTWNQVKDIRATDLTQPGITQRKIALLYSVDPMTISDIIKNKTWKE